MDMVGCSFAASGPPVGWRTRVHGSCERLLQANGQCLRGSGVAQCEMWVPDYDRPAVGYDRYDEVRPQRAAATARAGSVTRPTNSSLVVGTRLLRLVGRQLGQAIPSALQRL